MHKTKRLWEEENQLDAAQCLLNL